MRRLTNKRSIAKAVLQLVKQEKHYNQNLWISAGYFADTTNDVASGTYLRQVLDSNRCGTTGCVAGNAVIVSIPSKAKVDWATDEVILPDGSEQEISDYARDALGLTNRQASWLFASFRTVEEVTAALELIAAGKTIDSLVPDYYS